MIVKTANPDYCPKPGITLLVGVDHFRDGDVVSIDCFPGLASETTETDAPRQAELIALWNMANETARAAIYATAKTVTEGLRNG